ncbi:MAG TPA: T9SS type A sorting domain-containing protein [Bacteroidota bacterium]|nr:T9SS type A sorting domain-containing protein [Bacteroidota bacterium]
MNLARVAAIVGAATLVCTSNSLAQTVFTESFSDGNFTTNPAWGGTDSTWIIVQNSDVSAGTFNSYTLRLNKLAGTAGVQYLSTQRTDSWGSEQSWSFWLGRRSQAATDQNHSIVWLWANEANLLSPTVDGYRVRFGDDGGGDEIVLQRVTDGVATNIITSDSTVPNGLTDIGLMVRVTRTLSSIWSLYTCVLPLINGTGPVATSLPSAAATYQFQGFVTDATYADFSGGFFGFMAVHSSGQNPRTAAEFDQFLFDTSASSLLPITLGSFAARINPSGAGVLLEWMTVSEINNYGFYVQRRRDSEQGWTELTGFVPGHGTTTQPHFYSYVDSTISQVGLYYYRLRQVDLDGTSHLTSSVSINVTSLTDVQESAPRVFQLLPNYPNPFNPTTTIRFAVEASAPATLELYDVLGQRVATLFDGLAEAGRYYRVNVDGSKLSSGTYIYRLHSGLRSDARKMLLMK